MSRFGHWITAMSPGVSPNNQDAVNMALEHPAGAFFISYVADVAAANRKFNLDKRVPATGDETALVHRFKGIIPGLPAYYILEGDHREAYEELLPEGWDACYQYYLNHKEASND